MFLITGFLSAGATAVLAAWLLERTTELPFGPTLLTILTGMGVMGFGALTVFCLVVGLVDLITAADDRSGRRR